MPVQLILYKVRFKDTNDCHCTNEDRKIYFCETELCKHGVCCAVESVFVNFSVQNLNLLSSAILIPVSQPLVICLEESG